MLKLIKKDYVLNLKRKWLIALTLLWFPIFVLIPHIDPFSIIMTGAMITLLWTVGFSEDTMDVLFHSLPVKGKDMIFSKYIMFFINFIFMSLYIMFIYQIMKQFNMENMKIITLDLIYLMFLIAVIVNSIMICIVISFSSAVKNGWAFLGPVIGFRVGRRLADGDVNEALEYLVPQGTLIQAFALIVFIASIFLSFYGYRDWEAR